MSAQKRLDVIGAIRHYVDRMVKGRSGMAALLVDDETMGIVSMIYTQSEILEHEVFLVDKISNAHRESMQHLKCIVLCRPTVTNVTDLCRELREHKYSEYDLYFTNAIPEPLVSQLANADEHSLVNSVQEYYADFYPVTYECFSLGIRSCADLYLRGEEATLNRVCDGLCAVLLALKKRPVVRYQASSEISGKLAHTLSERMEADHLLFDFRRDAVPPTLLIVDRRDDPVTPLLLQWTYAAMTHELLTIERNRVNMHDAPGVRKDLREIVLSPEHDVFYKENLQSNFGDLGENMKMLVDKYQNKAQINQNIDSIEDMQRFVEEYPEFRKMSGHVSKHVAVLHELSRLVQTRCLFKVSQVEQDLACRESHSEAYRAVQELLEEPGPSSADRLRAVMLFALRYQREATQSNELSTLLDTLQRKGLGEEDLGLVGCLLRHAGNGHHSRDLFDKGFFKAARKAMKKSVRGVENVYTQHEPLIVQHLDKLTKGKLSESDYPFHGQARPAAPGDVIIFVVGGATYEEAAAVADFNARNRGSMRVVLGGTDLINSSAFLNELRQLQSASRARSWSSS